MPRYFIMLKSIKGLAKEMGNGSVKNDSDGMFNVIICMDNGVVESAIPIFRHFFCHIAVKS